MNIRRIIAFFALVMTVLSVVATSYAADNTTQGNDDCAAKRSNSKVIGWDWPLSSLEMYDAFNKQVAAVAADRGYKTVTTSNNHNLQRQIRELNTWVTQGLAAFGTYALEPSAIEPIAERAAENCVGFVSYGADIKHQDASVGFAWAQSGRVLGKAALQWAKNYDGKVKVLILYDLSITAGKLRNKGLLSVFPGNASNVEIIGQQSASTSAQGLNVTSTILQAHPDLNMVLAYNDDVGIGARQAFINAGFETDDPDVFIGGQDGAPGALKLLLKKGDIYRASAAVRFDLLTSRVANTIVDVAEGIEPDYGPLKFEILTHDNREKVQKFIDAYKVNE